MGYLLILLFTVLSIGESMVIKAYAKKYSTGGMLMNAIICLFACLFYVGKDLIFDTGFNVPSEMIPLALINSVLYAAGFYLMFLAFKVGPYGLTSLIAKFALLFPIFYGIFFLNDPTTPLTYIGIALIVAAMFFMNYSGGKSGMQVRHGSGISFKWLLFSIVSLVANGFISILTKMQQLKFDKVCDNEFQMISTGGAFILLLIIGLIIDHADIKEILKHGTLYGLASGAFNGAKNLTQLAIFPLLPLSVISPTKTGVGLVLSFLVSLVFYKEKYTKIQIIGVALGAAAVIILAF